MYDNKSRNKQRRNVIKPMRYVNGLLEWPDASMGYLKCRKTKEMRKTVILVGKNWSYLKKKDLDDLFIILWKCLQFNSNISNKIHKYKIKTYTNCFTCNKNSKLYSFCSFIYYKYTNVKMWVTKYNYKQLFTPFDLITCICLIVLNLNMHWSSTFLQHHRCKVVTCISSPERC